MSLVCTDVTKHYRVGRQTFPTLTAATVALDEGRGLGAVGASGSGKSTLLHLLLRLIRPDDGRISLDGEPVTPRASAHFRRSVQFVPQDPAGSLDPRRAVEAQVREPLVRLGVEGDHDAMVAEALERVGLTGGLVTARPDSLSGGQAQRAAVARAIVTRHRFLLADEPVSGLDAPLRLQVLQLLAELRDQGVGILLVTHDLSSVHQVCTDLVVLAGGRIVERGTVTDVLHTPRHPVTRRLVDAAPRLVR